MPESTYVTAAPSESMFFYGKEFYMAMFRKQPEEAAELVTNNVPEGFWYWAAIVSILLSAILKMMKKDDAAIFVGQWPPTFLLFGLYHRLVGPGK